MALAHSKAFTSLAMRMATGHVGRMAQPGGDLYGISNALDGRSMVVPGGLLLEVDGAVVGAVGASGGTGPRDEDVAGAAVAAFHDLVSNPYRYW